MKNKPYSKRPAPNKSGDLRLSKRQNPSTATVDISSIITPKGKEKKVDLPELLAPAGSLEALRAAIAAGADAVYFGGGEHNARINAQNLSNDEIEYGIKLLHSYGRRAYITLNTLVLDREIDEYLRFAELVAGYGADALIVADLGGASAIRRYLPELALHASTQMSGHNPDQASLLSSLGFSRMVCAREMSREDLRTLVKQSPIEIEAFVHGALCVCHSGQCLFSSIVGGRSGNRGKCAQPCRLPFTDESGKTSYPLSLKDLSLAQSVTELVDMGIKSFKIEGRMKSPEYVFGVTRAFRTLLDNGENATDKELSSLAKIFSRGGFTDGYFKKKIDSSMLGIRSESDKQESKIISATLPEGISSLEPQKIPVSLFAKIKKDEPTELTVSTDTDSVTVLGPVPEIAIKAPLSEEDVKRSLTKLGNTDFYAASFDAELSSGVIVPVSALNALRRSATDALSAKMQKKEVCTEKYIPKTAKSQRKDEKSARFLSPEQIPSSAYEFFDVIYLPLEKFDEQCNGVIIPPVIFSSEKERVRELLKKAKEKGAKYALIGNLGALELVREYDLSLVGDLRLNVFNNESAAALESLGLESVILSPELTLPQMRDIGGNASSVVYGRLPLMLLEKCVIREVANCKTCESDKALLTDRRGVSFPVVRDGEHRNIVYNSIPTYMADKSDELARMGVRNQHFIFSTETKEECERVISAYEKRLPPPANEKIRRI